MFGKNRYTVYVLAALCGLIFSCHKPEEGEETPPPAAPPEPHLPETPYDYLSFTLPPDFSLPPLSLTQPYPADNPTTNAGAALGRVLFYDRRLSLNQGVSCGSCHRQENGFADPAALSKGFNGGLTDRNSMALANPRFYTRLFWDLRANSLEQQALMPIQHPVEMGMDLTLMVERLRQTGYYPPLFQQAFGSEEITADRVAKALAQFVRSMYTYRSRYDIGKTNGFADFTPQETMGRNLFMGGTISCNFCHGGANFQNNQALNNGLDSVYTDNGLGAINGDAGDLGKFKPPTLRNIALTAPYMHDGRFATLEEVVDFYDSGVQHHPNLDDRLAANATTGGPPRRLHLSPEQKAALVAFLKTLTDETFIHDDKFSDPFE